MLHPPTATGMPSLDRAFTPEGRSSRSAASRVALHLPRSWVARAGLRRSGSRRMRRGPFVAGRAPARRCYAGWKRRFTDRPRCRRGVERDTVARRPGRPRPSQLRAALRREDAGRHLGHGHRVRSEESAQLRAHRRGRRERQNARVRLRIARRHPAVAQRHHAADAEGGHEASRHRLAVAAQPVHVLLRQRGIRRRPPDERQRSDRIGGAEAGAARRAPGCSRRSRTAAPAVRSR